MDIMIAGVGGQGTILTSKILAYASLLEGNIARTGETIGMSQRGGCVVSHVRTKNSFSPYIPKGQADLLFSFELCEGARNLPFLKENGAAIINTSKVTPITVALGAMEYDEQGIKDYITSNRKAYLVDANKIALECGNVKSVNVVLIGIAFGLGLIDMSEESIINSIKANVKPQFFEMNVSAFRAGIASIK